LGKLDPLLPGDTGQFGKDAETDSLSQLRLIKHILIWLFMLPNSRFMTLIALTLEMMSGYFLLFAEIAILNGCRK
jgi:hypothetical protein